MPPPASPLRIEVLFFVEGELGYINHPTVMKAGLPFNGIWRSGYKGRNG